MNIIRLALAILVSFLPGLFGMLYAPGQRFDAWYILLEKSVLNPDGWVFSVAWTILYILLGIALYLLTQEKKSFKKKKRAYKLFGLHLFLNALWSYTFFGLHLMEMSLIVLIVLTLVAFFMQREFTNVNKTAAWLVWSYIAWLIFAMYLNATIVYLN